MIVSKWLVDEELAKNSSLHFELISTIAASRDWEYPCDSGSGLASVTFGPAPRDVGNEEH